MPLSISEGLEFPSQRRATAAVPCGSASQALGRLQMSLSVPEPQRPLPEVVLGWPMRESPPSGLLNGPSYICGLRQNSADRSNLALQNAGAASEGDITLQVTVYNGQTGASTVLPVEVLSPGEFRQLSGILALQGLQIQNGYARVERVSGTAPFYTYGVINDQANSDGSFVPPILESSLVGKTGLTLPVIVESGTFVSEVVVTNWSGVTKTIGFEYTADAVQAADKTARFSLTLPPGRQFIDPNLVQGLRSASIPGIGPAGPVFVGALYASVAQGDVSGISVAARTATPGGGGKLGLFYSAIPAGGESTTSAWVYGLQQNTENRTNLAIVNTGLTDRSTDVFTIELYDGNTGIKVATVQGISLAADAWMQIGTILAQYAPGTTQGYARVTRTSGTNPLSCTRSSMMEASQANAAATVPSFQAHPSARIHRFSHISRPSDSRESGNPDAPSEVLVKILETFCLTDIDRCLY